MTTHCIDFLFVLGQGKKLPVSLAHDQMTPSLPGFWDLYFLQPNLRQKA